MSISSFGFGNVGPGGTSAGRDLTRLAPALTKATPPPLPTVLEPVDSAPEIRGGGPIQTRRVNTTSGVRAEYRQDALGIGIQAALPAGGLLPAPVLIEALKSGNNHHVRAFLANGEALQSGVTHDGRHFVKLDNENPNAPLLMFDPNTLDYGLASPTERQPDGSMKTLLQETIHADGTQNIIQDDQTLRDGSRSFNQVVQDPQGNIRGGTMKIDAAGRTQWTEKKASIDDEKISLWRESQGPAKGLADHAMDSIKNPLAFKSPLFSWIKERSEPTTRVSEQATFRTFSQAVSANPGGIFPGLMAALAETQATRPVTKVLQGDIAQIPAQAVLAPINSGGMWMGGVDRAIYGSAGSQYHQQVQNMDLRDGQFVLAGKQQNHRGAYQDVAFVVDDLKKPLGDLLYDGLKSADRAGVTSINLPAMRTGVMSGVMENESQAVQAMASAIKRFQAEGPESLKDINVIVYQNPRLAQNFERALASN